MAEDSSFGKRNVLRLHLNESREGFCGRGRGRSFHFYSIGVIPPFLSIGYGALFYFRYHAPYVFALFLQSPLVKRISC